MAKPDTTDLSHVGLSTGGCLEGTDLEYGWTWEPLASDAEVALSFLPCKCFEEEELELISPNRISSAVESLTWGTQYDFIFHSPEYGEKPENCTVHRITYYLIKCPDHSSKVAKRPVIIKYNYCSISTDNDCSAFASKQFGKLPKNTFSKNY